MIMEFPILTAMAFSPLILGFVLLLLPSEPKVISQRVALVFSLVPFLLSLLVLANFDAANGHLQMIESVEWMPSLGITYSVGVDGFSIWLVLLTTMLTPIVMLGSWTDIRHRTKEFMFFMLVLEWGMLGALISIDLFLFFLFWELMLFPMAFVLGIWGGPRRHYALVKFVLFTMAGSALMLVAILYLVLAHGQNGEMTFDILSLYETPLTYTEQTWLFWAFAIAFFIKVPLFPVHTWLPDAHTEAPTGGSVDLAGILLKMGAYAFVRFAIPLFPLAAEDGFPIVIGLAVFGIVYGAMVAYPQKDMKRLVAYSSVSHMGFVILGLYSFDALGVTGGVLQMVNHGLVTGGLFLAIGFIYDRTHTRQIPEYGGLWSAVPTFCVILLILTFASIGLPGTNSFVGEFLILLGAFRTHPWAAALATTGVVLGAVYMLTMYKNVVFGPLGRVVTDAKETLTDLNAREVLSLAPILLFIFWIGIYPKPFLDRIEPTVAVFLARVHAAGATKYIEAPKPGILVDTAKVASR
ncbi:MAG: NADH-quinone oxidoreductase subunit M [Deltaproteobacteria bacterium]